MNFSQELEAFLVHITRSGSVESDDYFISYNPTAPAGSYFKSIAASALSLPSGGNNGDVLSTDGAGNYSWVAQSGGGGTVYADLEIVVGDGVTAGGDTYSTLTYNHANGVFAAINSTNDGIISDPVTGNFQFGFANASPSGLYFNPLNAAFVVENGIVITSLANNILIHAPTDIHVVGEITASLITPLGIGEGEVGGFYVYGLTSAGALGDERGFVSDFVNSAYYIGDLVATTVISLTDETFSVNLLAQTYIWVDTSIDTTKVTVTDPLAGLHLYGVGATSTFTEKGFIYYETQDRYTVGDHGDWKLEAFAGGSGTLQFYNFGTGEQALYLDYTNQLYSIGDTNIASTVSGTFNAAGDSVFIGSSNAGYYYYGSGSTGTVGGEIGFVADALNETYGFGEVGVGGVAVDNINSTFNVALDGALVLSLEGTGFLYQIGDLGGTNNGTHLIIDDLSSALIFESGGIPYLIIDVVTGAYTFGDTASSFLDIDPAGTMTLTFNDFLASNGVSSLAIDAAGFYILDNIPEFADDTAAGVGLVPSGGLYKTTSSFTVAGAFAIGDVLIKQKA